MRLCITLERARKTWNKKFQATRKGRTAQQLRYLRYLLPATHKHNILLTMKSVLVFAVAAASAEAALGFAPVAPAAPRSGVLALRAQVFFVPACRHGPAARRALRRALLAGDLTRLGARKPAGTAGEPKGHAHHFWRR